MKKINTMLHNNICTMKLQTTNRSHKDREKYLDKSGSIKEFESIFQLNKNREPLGNRLLQVGIRHVV